MNHPAELRVHKFLTDVRNGEAAMTEAALERVVSDVAEALDKQFGEGSRGPFSLRMSNIGRPYCQLWYEKNKPEVAEPLPSTFIMNMLIGDIVEAAFKGILKAAGVEYSDGHKTVAKFGDTEVPGTHDIVIDGKVDDIKSASKWSYDNKFKDYDSLVAGDAFGYIGQLVGYSKGLGIPAGGWWVINKANGEFKYVKSDLDNPISFQWQEEVIQDKIDELKENKFRRSFSDVEETFRRKPTGNRHLCKSCDFCSYKQDCWPNAKLLPSIPSEAKNKPLIWYTHVEEDSNKT